MFSNKKLYVMLAAVLLVAGFLLWHALPSDPAASAPVLTARAEIADIAVEVRTVGELDAANSLVVSSAVRGDRGKIIEMVEDGTSVDNGDILIRLDPSTFEEEVLRLRSRVIELASMVKAQEQLLEWEKNQAEREIYRAESDLHVAGLELRRLEMGEGPKELARIEADVRKAQEEFEKKRRYLDALNELKERGFSNPTEIEQIENIIADAEQAFRMAEMQFTSYRDHLLPIQIEKAKAALAAAEINLEQIKRGSGYKIGQAMATLDKSEQELEVARQNLQKAQEELAAATIRAPGPGMVVFAEQMREGGRRKPRIGDQVWQNQPLVYLPDVSRMIVNTQVREIDLHKIDIGKPVSLRVDAYPQLQLTGKVTTIGILADARESARQGGKYFKVAITVDQPDPRLRPGMTARVTILCDTVKNVLTAPVFAIFGQNDRFFAYVDVRASFEKREVRVGLQSDHLVQIISGLSPGDAIALSEPPADDIRGIVLLENPAP
ncbi:MAG: efflux RND transporter periplasmic adaptor subunit [Desulfobacteraceae bacterium]|jgi:HlyD family secretion protein|nr:MAG: efflux RND transporter periplasmic adaptor subunit [Desulfobacteraceae bacterium]